MLELTARSSPLPVSATLASEAQARRRRRASVVANEAIARSKTVVRYVSWHIAVCNVACNGIVRFDAPEQTQIRENSSRWSASALLRGSRTNGCAAFSWHLQRSRMFVVAPAARLHVLPSSATQNSWRHPRTACHSRRAARRAWLINGYRLEFTNFRTPKDA